MGIADEHFPAAIQIVDLYHAREHLAHLAKGVYGSEAGIAKRWLAARYTEWMQGRWKHWQPA